MKPNLLVAHKILEEFPQFDPSTISVRDHEVSFQFKDSSDGDKLADLLALKRGQNFPDSNIPFGTWVGEFGGCPITVFGNSWIEEPVTA